jgi:HSP20 family protein
MEVNMMGSLMPWKTTELPDPFNILRREVDSLFEKVLGSDGGFLAARMDVIPHYDLAETDREYEVSVEMPGLRLDDFCVEWRDDALWITGEKKQETEKEGKTYHRIGRTYGQFRCIVQLAAGVDADHISAAYTDGVLRVTVPKTEAVKPKRIAIKAGSEK